MLVIAILIGLIPAAIAKGKGRSFVAWWFYRTAPQCSIHSAPAA